MPVRGEKPGETGYYEEASWNDDRNAGPALEEAHDRSPGTGSGTTSQRSTLNPTEWQF